MKETSSFSHRVQKGIEVFLIQALFFGVLWGLYDREANAYLVFAGVALTLLLFIYSLIRHWNGLKEYGIQTVNTGAALKSAVTALLSVALICFGFAWLKGTGIAWPKWTRYIEFPLAGLLQQLIFQGYFYNRYESVFRRRTAAIVLSALTFAFFHLPNRPLMLVTFLTGLYAAYFFARFRNIFILALLHGWISLMLTMTLEPAGFIQSYKVGPLPMGPMKREIQSHLIPETRIGRYVPSEGVEAGFQHAFDRPVESFEAPYQLDQFLDSEAPVFLAVDKVVFGGIENQLKSPYHVWHTYDVWLRKFPHRRSRTLKCVLTFNYSRLKKYYREEVLLLSNRARPAA